MRGPQGLIRSASSTATRRRCVRHRAGRSVSAEARRRGRTRPRLHLDLPPEANGLRRNEPCAALASPGTDVRSTTAARPAARWLRAVCRCSSTSPRWVTLTHTACSRNRPSSAWASPLRRPAISGHTRLRFDGQRVSRLARACQRLPAGPSCGSAEWTGASGSYVTPNHGRQTCRQGHATVGGAYPRLARTRLDARDAAGNPTGSSRRTTFSPRWPARPRRCEKSPTLCWIVPPRERAAAGERELAAACALVALRSAGLDVVAVAERMPGGRDADVPHLAAAQGRRLLTFDRDYGELVFARAASLPRAIVYLRQAAYAPDWPARVVLDLLRRRDWVAGHLVVVSGRALRRRPLPARWATTRRCASRPCSTGRTARGNAA